MLKLGKCYKLVDSFLNSEKAWVKGEVVKVTKIVDKETMANQTGLTLFIFEDEEGNILTIPDDFVVNAFGENPQPDLNTVDVLPTLQEWDSMANELENKVIPNYNDDARKYHWALYGGLLQSLKDQDISIDEALIICFNKYHEVGKRKKS